MSQTIDVSAGYTPCRQAADGSPHTTHFVHATGHQTNDLTSTMFGKIYQMFYLAGLVAGDALAAPRGSPMATPRGSSCVGFIAPFPLPEVQRHINAFALGCRLRHTTCIVKVVFTGSWHSAEVEGGAASFLWHEEGCDIITQGTDTAAAQIVYKELGGLGIGYNSHARELVGDSVLTAPMLHWGAIYAPFVEMLLAGSWQPEVAAWLGAAEGAVGLAPSFSPRVPPATIRRVEEEMEKLRAAPGDLALRQVFCGPLRKRWAYAFKDGSSGPRATGCGANPTWRRLEEPEQLNLNHYRDASGRPLPANRTTPLPTDCLWGVERAGEALLGSAFPPHPGDGDSDGEAFDEDRVFMDYLIEGIELPEARTTLHGTVHSEASHACFSDYGTLGDRFYTETPVAVPPSPPPPSMPPVEVGEDYSTALAASIGAIGGLLLLLLLSLCVAVTRRSYARIKQALAAEEAASLAKTKRIQDAVKCMRELTFPFCVIRLDRFKALGQLVRHEKLRDRGQLDILDTWEEAVAFGSAHAVVFNSHQWLALSAPDSADSAHYRSMVAAAEVLCQQDGIREDELHLWVE